MATGKGMLCPSPPGQGWSKAWRGSGLKLQLQWLVTAQYCTWNCWAWFVFWKTGRKVGKKSQRNLPTRRSSTQPQLWDPSSLQRRDQPCPCTTVRYFSPVFFPQKFAFPPVLHSWTTKLYGKQSQCQKTPWGLAGEGSRLFKRRLARPLPGRRSQAQLRDHPQREHEFVMSGSGGQNLAEDTLCPDLPLQSEEHSHRRVLCSERIIYSWMCTFSRARKYFAFSGRKLMCFSNQHLEWISHHNKRISPPRTLKRQLFFQIKAYALLLVRSDNRNVTHAHLSCLCLAQMVTCL